MLTERFNFKKFLQSKITLVVVCIVLVLIAVNAGKIFYKNYEADKDIEALKKDVAVLEDNHRRLEKINTFFESDFFAEKEARLKFGMRKEGEHVVVIQDAQREDGAGENNKKGEEGVTTILPGGREVFIQNNKKSNPIQWWDYFFGA